jgi:hypothetical protein
VLPPAVTKRALPLGDDVRLEIGLILPRLDLLRGAAPDLALELLKGFAVALLLEELGEAEAGVSCEAYLSGG